ncbi:MAG: tRNA (guanosine(46)-N7)-methyltransferase TrmB [Alphaproteobacteria bacterium]
MSKDINTEKSDSAHKKRSLFGRRQGRAIKNERARVLDEVLPDYTIPTALLTETQSHKISEYFNAPCKEYWLEIGFGYGEHVAGLLQQNPDTGYLAAEPFINGMSAFLKDNEDSLTDNVHLLMDDGMMIAKSLAPDSLDGIYILNPDPWHKKRHHKRRIICPDNLDIFATILKPGGSLVMTTDVEDLGEWMCTQAMNHPAFKWNAKNKSDWYDKPDGWITTRYEEKGAKGAKKMVYLMFTRI